MTKRFNKDEISSHLHGFIDQKIDRQLWFDKL